MCTNNHYRYGFIRRRNLLNNCKTKIIEKSQIKLLKTTLTKLTKVRIVRLPLPEQILNFLKLYNKSAMNAIIYQNFQKIIESFYLKLTNDHPLKFTLRNRFKAMQAALEKDLTLLPDLELRTLPPKAHSQNQSAQPQPEFLSLRKTQPKQPHISLNKSRCLLDKSSREATEKGGQFNSEWICQSDQPSKILFYAIMLAFILNDNKLSFKYFQDKINDHLDECKDFSDYELSIISRQWQLIGTLLLKSRPSKWKISLRQAVQKFPANFTKLACRIMLPLNESADFLGMDSLTKLAKEHKVAVHYFTINYREIEHVQTVGKFSQEIYIGRLKHKNVYVVANQLPEYSEEQRALREVRGRFAQAVKELLEVYEKNNEEIAIESSSKVMKEKEVIARQFLANCLRQ